jgi:hypothetical protein
MTVIFYLSLKGRILSPNLLHVPFPFNTASICFCAVSADTVLVRSISSMLHYNKATKDYTEQVQVLTFI